MPIAFASTVTYLLPIVAVILGATVLGEPITWNLFVGTAIVLAGVAASDRRLARSSARGERSEPVATDRRIRCAPRAFALKVPNAGTSRWVMKRSLVVVCAVVVCACGEESEAPSAAADKPADRSALVAKANRVCKAAQPEMDRAGEQIERSAAAGERNPSKRHREANREGWYARYRVMTDMFTRLRALEKTGVDRRYDAFLAQWGVILGTLESLAEKIGGDQEELEVTFGAFQQYANELVDVAIAAEVLDCAAPFAPGGDPGDG
jgi:hypothetical protein